MPKVISVDDYMTALDHPLGSGLSAWTKGRPRSSWPIIVAAKGWGGRAGGHTASTKRSAESNRSIASGFSRPIRGPSADTGRVKSWSTLT